MELCHQKPRVECVRERALYIRERGWGWGVGGIERKRNKNTTLNQTVPKSWLKFAPVFPLGKENIICKTLHKSFRWCSFKFLMKLRGCTGTWVLLQKGSTWAWTSHIAIFPRKPFFSWPNQCKTKSHTYFQKTHHSWFSQRSKYTYAKQLFWFSAREEPFINLFNYKIKKIQGKHHKGIVKW